jgi:hypothetical protein
MPVPANLQRSAIISTDERYRYRLSRWWNDKLPWVTYLMLNPSTADALIDDATIRKCIGFAERWGYGGIDVINLFALRSRDPLGILTEPFPAGPEYMSHLFDAIKKSKLLIAAWGCESTLKKSPVLLKRPAAVLTTIRTVRPDLPVQCLGMSKTGNPYHPLMLGYDTQRIPFGVK